MLDDLTRRNWAMYEALETIIITRPLDEVFAFVAGSENDPQW